MPEGLSAAEVGKDIAEHAEHHARAASMSRHERIVSIAEAVLLSLVTLIAAWSAYSAAKWSTESSVELADASVARTEANRASYEAMNLRNFDSSTFNAWFSAYAVGNERLMALAQRRFRPAFRVAFDAWRATDPESGKGAAGPTYMPQYRQPAVAEAARLDAHADEAFAAGTKAGETSDDYVRATIFLASVLFLVGISTHFPLPGVRYGLVCLGAIILLAAVVQILQLERPPA
jgi:hypothetical protein